MTATGLSASDAGDFTGNITLQLTSPSGTAGPSATVSLTPGMTIGNIVTALNTAFSGNASFTLTSNGAITMTPSSSYQGYSLGVTSDSTERASTGMSLSVLFGLGTQQTIDEGASIAVNPAIAQGQQGLAFAQPQITASTAAGDSVVSPGDNSGLLALENLSNTQVAFAAAGGLNAQTNTLGNYAGGIYQDIATRTQTAQANATSASDQLTEAQTRQSQVSGVNLDEELSNMVTYQQAYSAGARIMQTATDIYNTLLQIPT